MAVNKIQFDGQILIDLTSDTVAAERLQSGYTAHDANGNVITGTLALPSGSITLTANGTYDVTNKASAVVAVPALSVTNILTAAVELDGTTPYNGGLGYKQGYRLSANGAESAYSDYCISGYIPVLQNDIIRVINVGEVVGYSILLFGYNASGTADTGAFAALNPVTLGHGDGMVSCKITSTNTRFIRFAFNKAMIGKVIVTKNEKISPLEV